MKIVKLVMAVVIVSAAFTSCSVQQFGVNTTVEPFQHGGKVFGEKTKGKEFKKKGELFIAGINVLHNDTKKMSEDLKASSYTIETKNNWLSWTVSAVSYGLLDYKVVKVIKRNN
jgi:hypothetical protein